jgi:TonB family protein
MRWWLRLYPRAWRERYRDEVAALLASEKPTLRVALDLIFGAVDARLNPQWIPALLSPGGDAAMSAIPVSTATFPLETANSRFKESFKSWFWSSMIIATALHFAVLVYWPDLRASDLSFEMDEIEAIELPPEIEIPPPPEAIARPANPVITTAEIDTNVTIAPTTFESNPIDDLPPPPQDAAVDISSHPTFTVTEVVPEITNRDAVARALERAYPPTLRDTGIEGSVVLYFLLNEEGETEKIQVGESSGFEQFDDAALDVGRVVRFTPALNHGERVAVWIQLPINFTTRR